MMHYQLNSKPKESPRAAKVAPFPITPRFHGPIRINNVQVMRSIRGNEGDCLQSNFTFASVKILFIHSRPQSYAAFFQLRLV